MNTSDKQLVAAYMYFLSGDGNLSMQMFPAMGQLVIVILV